MNPSTIVKPCSKKVFENNTIFCLFDDNEIENFSQDLLDSHYWQSNNQVVGTAQGRGTTWFIEVDNKQWVLKHYYRGGLIGKFNKDSYLFSSNDNTRATKEFELLNQLRALDLPAPKPIACRVIKSGLFYKADILTERVCNAQDLISLLIKQSVNADLWHNIGKTIKAFHDHDVYHHDLNIHNILIDDQNKVWLIDFDQGEIKTGSSNWKEENMSRLLRSFNKEKNKLEALHWQANEWDLLLTGYTSE
ncbi:3-deoxy-D-manno-octulosonic acid kinase [Pseudocolwellia sp. HL-MZ19]|uniref:3-deoxy-D-manno-octulosonic acid kinase n=1 Tax=unclassified Pseudocolwellia TaxID=2848178 RepID=UPI003CFB6D93